jgi:NADPH-dependent 2,4-dienoyl-CoA reductase/sulfur reductase-like enzyme
MLVTADGELEKRVLTPYDRLFKLSRLGEVVVGRVTKVEDGSVTLEDGRSLHYDYLVLATGSHWAGPLNLPDTMEETTAWIDEWRKKFQNATSIVLLGGGAVGVGESDVKHVRSQC